ncbi:OsmC family protein [Vulgatibacter incomptus]|uniref:OsmC family protein n=1 Tax=Vulgatibacter incomptus TaxID=1391653 RepID=A0A0K1PGQ1_9BACT|nr:OsmC family protein [Vulgatibacter incomptus]AKU92601.1 hypothetical protein AKJ08_2988 [Vulgatibacter incomptus]
MEELVNGVDVHALGEVIEKVRADPSLARFRFRVSNRWDEGGHSETTIDGFYGAGAEQTSDNRPFTLEADEAPVLLGEDRAPNAVEHLLNALATCMTGSLAYHAAARGIRLDRIESELRGEIDLRGFLGISDQIRNGFQHIEATFRVEGDGTEEELAELIRFSPVLDVVSNGTDVSLRVEKLEAAEAPSASPEELHPPA